LGVRLGVRPGTSICISIHCNHEMGDQVEFDRADAIIMYGNHETRDGWAGRMMLLHVRELRERQAVTGADRTGLRKKCILCTWCMLTSIIRNKRCTLLHPSSVGGALPHPSRGARSHIHQRWVVHIHQRCVRQADRLSGRCTASRCHPSVVDTLTSISSACVHGAQSLSHPPAAC
jgi:hypothetical protein